MSPRARSRGGALPECAATAPRAGRLRASIRNSVEDARCAAACASTRGRGRESGGAATPSSSRRDSDGAALRFGTRPARSVPCRSLVLSRESGAGPFRRLSPRADNILLQEEYYGKKSSRADLPWPTTVRSFRVASSLSSKSLMGLDLRLDPWDSGYGSEMPMSPDPDAVREDVDLGIERPASEWTPLPPGRAVAVPGRLAFVDGVRRVEARVVARHDGQLTHGAFGSYGVGAALGENGRMRIEHERVER